MTATSTFQRTCVGSPFDAASVYDVMRVGVVTCVPGTSLQDAAKTISAARTGPSAC